MVLKPFLGFWRPHRYKVFHGGRGSGKSWQVAQALIVMANAGRIRVLCCREIQNSIRESSYQLFKDTAERLGLSDRFEFIESEIRNKLTGSKFIFKGLLRNEQPVKSTEDIDICWVEEAQKKNLKKAGSCFGDGFSNAALRLGRSPFEPTNANSFSRYNAQNITQLPRQLEQAYMSSWWPPSRSTWWLRIYAAQAST